MEMLKNMKSTLMGQAQAQMANLQNVDAKELGEVIDMIKDLEEAIYYCTIVEAMEHKDKESSNGHSEKAMYYVPMAYYRDMDKSNGRMYYDDGMYNYNRMYYNGGSNGGSSSSGGMSGGNSDGSRGYQEREYYPYDMRDVREGRSPMSRKSYMETKEMHHDKSKQLQELEKYTQELTTDIVDMIKDATPEEKQLLQRKLQTLATKIEQA